MINFSKWVLLRESDSHHIGTTISSLISRLDEYIRTKESMAPGKYDREILDLSLQMEKSAEYLLSQDAPLNDAGRLLNNARQLIVTAQNRNNLQDHLNMLNQAKKYLETSLMKIQGFHSKPWETGDK